MRRTSALVVAAGLAAITVFVILLPVSGNDSDPPECFAAFDYVVPCGLGPDQAHGMGFAVAGGLLAAVLVVLGYVVARVGREE